jgi:catalase
LCPGSPEFLRIEWLSAVQNEPLMKGVSRRWMLWHMFDAHEQERIVQLLRQHQEDYEVKVCRMRSMQRMADVDGQLGRRISRGEISVA